MRKKKIICFIAVFAIIAIFNVNLSSTKLSDIYLDNIEALGNSEGDGSEYGGGDVNKCYKTTHYNPIYKDHARPIKYCGDNCLSFSATKWADECK